MSANRSERGAALVTVMMIVAAMSIAALGLTQLMLAQTQRARAMDVQAQLRMYAVAAEEVAEIQLAELMRRTEGRLNLAVPGLGLAQTFPIEQGAVTVTAFEATNCFNMNALVSGLDRGAQIADEDEVAVLQHILGAAEIDDRDADRMIAAAVDWMDSDLVARIHGGEDGYYMGLRPAYRTAGRPLANMSELRAIFGFSETLLTGMDHLLCVRPETAMPDGLKVNINTLTEAQAPLLVPIMSGQLSERDARQLIYNRPLGGWTDVESFAAEPAIAKISPELRKMQQISTVSTHLEVLAEVSYRGYTASVVYQFEILAGQPVRLIHRERVG